MIEPRGFCGLATGTLTVWSLKVGIWNALLQIPNSKLQNREVPIFEFRCQDCGKKFSDLVGMTADSSGGDEQPSAKCPHCGSERTSKLVSRFQRYRNEDDRVDAMADRLELMGEPDSPSAMRDMVREMGKAMDEDMSDEMEEMYEADMEGKLEDED